MSDLLRLYLDDDRPCPEGWVPARTVAEAVSILSQHQGPFEVSLDHDLGRDENDVELPNGTKLVKWMMENERYPENAQIHSGNPVGRGNIQHDLNFMDRMRNSSVQKTSHWADVFAKAVRLKRGGNVIIQRNGYEQIVAMVRGDNGIYQVEIKRDDPNSRAMAMWSCSCPWAQFVWFRSPPWKKYEGRSCSHCLAALWTAWSTPLDEDAQEQWDNAKNQRGQKAPQKQPPRQYVAPVEETTPGAPEGPPGGPGATMINGPEEDWPLETDEVMPTQLPLEPPTQGPLPKQPELPFKPAEPGGSIVQPTTEKGELATPNPIEQGLIELQKQLGPEETNFLKQKYPQFFKIPGTLSHVAAAGKDFDAIYAMLYPEPGSRKVEQNPTCEMLADEWGEMLGGLHPIPGARVVRLRQTDQTPIYHRDDMGWDPVTQTQPTMRDRAHVCPKRRGDYGRIPAGAHVSVQDADPTTGWVLVNYPIEQGDSPPGLPYMQHRWIVAWVESRNVRMIGSERLTPHIKRQGPMPDEQAEQVQNSDPNSDLTQWTPDEPIDDWA